MFFSGENRKTLRSILNGVKSQRNVFLNTLEGFEDRNPGLELIGAYIHMDEASPHMHFDYIPVATGYKTGDIIRELEQTECARGHRKR